MQLVGGLAEVAKPVEAKQPERQKMAISYSLIPIPCITYRFG
jgi:hypothetical protein